MGKDNLKGIRLSDLYKQSDEEKAFWEDYNKNNPYAGAQLRVDPKGFTSGITDIVQLPDFGQSRYDDVMPGYNSDYFEYEDLRGERQSGLEQIANGILKGAITAGTTFTNTLVGIPVGLVTAAVEGRLSGIWDNAVTNTMSNIDDWAEKELPNYYTREELESPWYTNIFSTNFLGDKLIKNFGFTFGSGAAGKLISKMPKLLTTIAPKIAKATGATAQNIASIGRVTNTFETGLISAIGEGSIEALNATKEWSAAMTNRINQEQAIKLQALQQEYEDGLSDILQNYGDTELGQRLALNYQKEIQQRASAIENDTNRKMAQVASQRAQLGNAVLGFNLPILTLSNMALLGRIYTNGWSAEQQSLGKFISSDMSKLAAAGTTTSQTTKNLLGKEITKDVVNNVYKNNLTLAKNILRGVKQHAGEGVEEMEQLIASNTVKAYNDDYFAQSVDPNATDRTADMWYSLAHQFGETLGDINNWEEFFIGMVSSGISNIVLGANKGLSQERREVQNLVDALNDRVNTFNSRNLIQGLNRHGQYGDQMVESAIRGDKKDFKDAEFAQTVSDVIMWSEAGKIDDLKQIIDYNLDNNLTDEELENIAESLSQKDSEGGEHNSFAAGSNSYRRQYIQDQKDKYHKVIDLYTQERENLVGLVGSTFSKEELSELTYLRLRAQDSATRSEELQDTLLKRIDAFAQKNLAEQASAKTDLIETSQLKTILKNRLKSDKKLLEELDWNAQAADYMGKNQSGNYYTNLKKRIEKRIQNTEKLLAKDFTKAIENEQKFAYLKELLGVQTANIETYTSALDFIKTNFKKAIDLNANKLSANNVIEVAQNINDLVSILSNVKAQDTTIKELETTIEDAIRLVNDADAYNKKLNEFINNPTKLATKNEGLAERARNKQIEKEADKVEQDIANTENFNEFSRKLNSLDPRVKAKVLQRLKDKQNKNAQEYNEKNRIIDLVLNYISKSNVEPRIKQIATSIFNNAANALSTEELTNIDSSIYSREANQQLDDNTYVNVKTLLAEAFKFQSDETSEPVQEDTLNLNDAPKAKETYNEKKPQTREEYLSDVEEENTRYEEALADQDLNQSEREENVETIGDIAVFETIAPSEQTFNKVENATPVSLVNISGSNNLTEKEVSVDEGTILNESNNQPVTKPDTKGNDDVMGMQKIDTKSDSENFGKPAIEEIDEQTGELAQQAKNSKLLYDKLKELGAFDNVDNGVVQKDSRVYFGLIPSLDQTIKEQNNYDGTTILLFVDDKCVGHLAPRSKSHAQLIQLLKDEFKGKLDTTDVLVSKKYYTIADDIWSGVVLYNKSYRKLTNNDLNWTRDRLNSSVTSQDDRTPLFTIFDGSTGFRKDSEHIFRYGDKVAPVYMDNPLYKGTPVLLIPTGAYDRNKSNTQQSPKAFIPVALRRVLFDGLSSNTATNRDISETISSLFKSNLTVKQLNETIGKLKSDLTYEFNTAEGKQQIFIVPARQVVRENTPTIVEMTPKMFIGIADKNRTAQDIFENEAYVTHLIIQRKINGKTISTYTVGIAQGTFQLTQALPQEMQDSNKAALVDFLKNEAKAYYNIDQNRLNNPDYIQQILDDELLQTNAKELRVEGNSFHMNGEILVDDGTIKQEAKQPEVTTKQTETISTTQEQPKASEEVSNPLLDLLGDNFDSTQQADTEGQERYSRVTSETTLGTIDTEKEINNILKVLPQLSRDEVFEIIEDLKTINDKGEKAQGIFNAGLITLSKLAEAGTGYHEAFHLVFNMILSKEERNDLLNEYRTKNPKLDDIDLEELMADDFKEFALLNENNISTTNWIQRVGQKIYNAFKKLANILHLYRHQPLTFNKVCSDIWQGKYANRTLQPTNSLRNSQEEYTQEMQQIKDQAIANGTFMKAPNSKPTNLTERQWLQVRTKAFKDWFGDWTKITFDKDGKVLNIPDDCSKVVDENGEPLVVYHGTNTRNITVFNPLKSDDKLSIFTTNSYDIADSYIEFEELANIRIIDLYPDDILQRISDEEFEKILEETNLQELAWNDGYIQPKPMPLFEILKNPLVVDAKNHGYATIPFGSNGEYFNTREISQIAKNNGYDGVIFKNLKDAGSLKAVTYTRRKVTQEEIDRAAVYGIEPDELGWVADTESAYIFIVFNPNQIKSATDNIGTFSKDNDDIRYSLSLTTKIAQANLTKQDYKELNSLAQDINKLYRKGRKAGSFAVQFRIKGNETGFFLTDNSEQRYINGKPTIVYNTAITKEFVEKYLKDNNLTDKYELKTNDRGDTKIMIKPDKNIKDKDTESSYIEYQRIVNKQREGYTLSAEESYELAAYPNKFNTEETCG